MRHRWIGTCYATGMPPLTSCPLRACLWRAQPGLCAGLGVCTASLSMAWRNQRRMRLPSSRASCSMVMHLPDH